MIGHLGTVHGPTTRRGPVYPLDYDFYGPELPIHSLKRKVLVMMKQKKV